jgi:hypothetical protein
MDKTDRCDGPVFDDTARLSCAAILSLPVLGVTRFTIHNYLNEIRGKTSQPKRRG